MSIVLHIERLVVDESLLAGGRAENLRGIFERALAGRLASPHAMEHLSSMGAAPSLPSVDLPEGSPPSRHLGARVADAVGDGLGVPAIRRPLSGGSHG